MEGLTPDGNRAGSRKPELFHAHGPMQVVLPGETSLPLPREFRRCRSTQPGWFQGQRCRFTLCNQLCPKIMISELRLQESAESGDVLSWCTSLPVTHPFLKGNSDFSGSSKSCFSATSSRHIPALGCFFWGAARQSRSKEGQWEGMDAGRSSAGRGYFGNSFLEPGSVSSAVVCTQQ